MKTRESQNRLDIMHYHIDTGMPEQKRWAEAKRQCGDVMRDPDNINFITVFREPRDRLLSFYTFFVEFETLVPIEEFFRQDKPDPKVVERLRNLGCKEFGIETEADLDEFIRTEIPEFELASLATAGREGCKGVLKDRSPFEKRPEDVQDKIYELTVLDRRLYDAGVEAFEEKRAAVAQDVQADLEQFEKLQALIDRHLAAVGRSAPVSDFHRCKAADYYENPPPMANF
eukprot:g17937.t1